MLSKKDERGHVCLPPDLRGKPFSFTIKCKCQLWGFFFFFFVDALFFLSFFKMYILIWLCQVLIAACGI